MFAMRLVPHRRDVDAQRDYLRAGAQLRARLMGETIPHPKRIFF